MKRLQAIADQIVPCEVFADVGCDHGIVGLYVAERGLAARICECDISDDSLNKARSLVGERAEYFSGDGFAPLTEKNVTVDQAVIAGMGGELIIKILEKCPNKPRLILGAQKNADKLRRYLVSHGYRIDRDFMVEDGGKFYDVIVAVEGEDKLLDDTEAFAGKYYRQKNADLKAWCEYNRKRVGQYKPTENNVKILSMIAEVEKWQR